MTDQVPVTPVADQDVTKLLWYLGLESPSFFWVNFRPAGSVEWTSVGGFFCPRIVKSRPRVPELAARSSLRDWRLPEPWGPGPAPLRDRSPTGGEALLELALSCSWFWLIWRFKSFLCYLSTACPFCLSWLSGFWFCQPARPSSCSKLGGSGRSTSQCRCPTWFWRLV